MFGGAAFLDVHGFQPGDGAQHGRKGAGVGFQPAEHDVHALGGEQDGAAHVEAAALGQQVGAQRGQVVEIGELVAGQVQIGVFHDGDDSTGSGVAEACLPRICEAEGCG